MNVIQCILASRPYRNLQVKNELKAELEKAAKLLEFTSIKSNNEIMKLRDDLISNIKKITRKIEYVFDINDLLPSIHTTMPNDIRITDLDRIYTRGTVTTLENRTRSNVPNHGHLHLDTRGTLGSSGTIWSSEESISSRFNGSSDAVTLQANNITSVDMAALNGDNAVLTSSRIQDGSVTIESLASLDNRIADRLDN